MKAQQKGNQTNIEASTISILTASVQPKKRVTKVFHCRKDSNDCPICDLNI